MRHNLTLADHSQFSEFAMSPLGSRHLAWDVSGRAGQAIRSWAPTGPITFDAFIGTSGDDTIAGTTTSDSFDMSQGGDDTVNGRAGNDSFYFGATFTAADQIMGGTQSASDTLDLNGNYSAGVVFNATTMVGVETIVFEPGHNYSLTTHDATVAAGTNMLVRADSLHAGDTLFFNGAAEGDGSFAFEGGLGVDRLIGGANTDQFYFAAGNLTASDRIDGGAGSNVIYLRGGADIVFGTSTFKNIDVFYFDAINDYSLTMRDANVDFGAVLYILGTSLSSGTLNFDGSQERDGGYWIYGGALNDTIIGGRQGDFIQGNDGADTVIGGLGPDAISYFAAADSTSTHYDTVVGFDFGSVDHFILRYDLGGVDAALNVGRLGTANFDNQLAGAITGAQLAAHHAVLFTPDAGKFAGFNFLIIDVNNTPGYQASADNVILLSGSVHLGSLDATDFSIFI